MGYLQDVDAWLEDRLAMLDAKEAAALKRAIKAKVLESYRNGHRDCMKRCSAILLEVGGDIKEEFDKKVAEQDKERKPRRKST